MKRAASIAARLLVLAASSLGVLLIAELALRLAGFEPPNEEFEQRAHLHRESAVPGLGYEPNPGRRGVLWGVEVEINSLGFRDAEYTPQKAPGTTRILALGDSITFGHRLAAEDPWPSRLERLLRDQGKAVEIMNLGVGGYAIEQERLFLESVGLALEPDYVILAYCVNDLASVSVNLQAILEVERLSGWWAKSRIRQWISLELAASSGEQRMKEMRAAELAEVEALAEVSLGAELDTLHAQLERGLQALGPQREASKADRIARVHLKWYSQIGRLHRLRAEFALLAELGRTHDVPLYFFIVPYLDDGDAEGMRAAWDTVYTIVSALAREAGFVVVEVTDALRKTGLERLRNDRSDAVHPSAQGHEVIARMLREAVRELPGLE